MDAQYLQQQPYLGAPATAANFANPLLPEPPKELPAELAGPRYQQVPMDRLRFSEQTVDLTPAGADAILQDALNGYTWPQAKAAAEMAEKDTAVASTLQLRVAAVTGTPWTIEPNGDRGDGNATAREIASAAETMLRSIAPGRDTWKTFDQLLTHMSYGCLPGYALSGIEWADGGARIDGFSVRDPWFFTFGNSMTPMLMTPNNSAGEPLQPGQWLYHRCNPRVTDPVRGGLIRPLLFVYAFRRAGTISLLQYMERFGLPFLDVSIDDGSFDKERSRMAAMARAFNSDGAAVHTKSTELKMISGPSGGEETHLKNLEYWEQVVQKIVLGQTLAAGGGAKGGSYAAAKVSEMLRQDIRLADCHELAETVRRDILIPWVRFNYGEGAPVPRMAWDIEASIDTAREATTLYNLGQALMQFDQAGVDVDLDDLSDRFNVTLKKGTPKVAPVAPLAPAAPPVPQPVKLAEVAA